MGVFLQISQSERKPTHFPIHSHRFLQRPDHRMFSIILKNGPDVVWIEYTDEAASKNRFSNERAIAAIPLYDQVVASAQRMLP